MPAVFFDCDSTILSVESLVWIMERSLRKTRSAEDAAEILESITDITNRGMSGLIPVRESIRLRLQLCKPSVSELKFLISNISDFVTDRMGQAIEQLSSTIGINNIFIISGGPLPVIHAVGELFGIPVENCFGVPLKYSTSGGTSDVDGSAAESFGDSVIVDLDGEDFDELNGKELVIQSILKNRSDISGPLIMIGDGHSDMLPRILDIVDWAIGFGVHVRRERVQKECDVWVDSMANLVPEILNLLDKRRIS